MKFNTTRFGELNIVKNEIINFPEGLLGFENMKEYTIFEMEEGNPLMWMQSLNDGALAFIIIRPFEFYPNYLLELTEKEVEFLNVESPEDTDVFAIVVVPEDPSNMTANLQGPLVINRKKNIAKQIISTNPKHKLKHYILKEMENVLKKTQGGE
ncbi:MAG: flagellar assembly protein FliW [Fusobacteria bacterium]|jgi:flagellar assembly factor FliW|nr:flagellar assembly protein FliW [Fusobacteriota bacterium]